MKNIKMYNSSSNPVSCNTITLDVKKVETALSKFEDIESSLNKIVNATSNSSSVKPADLIDSQEAVLTNLSTNEIIEPLDVSRPASYMAARYLIIVIERVRKLFNDIIKADNLELAIEQGNSSVGLIGTTTNSDNNTIKDNQYTLGDTVISSFEIGNKSDVSSSNYNITDSVDEDNISNSEVSYPDKGQYTIENTMIGTDSNGNKITINPGNYDIVDVKKDVNGNITGICIFVNGEKIWVSIKSENVISNENNKINNDQYIIVDAITVMDKDGNEMTIPPGNYDIIDFKKDANGNINSICIFVNGEKIWLTIMNGKVVANNNLNVENNQYMLVIPLTITDIAGNKIIIEPGNYDVIDVKKDDNGNVTAICILVDNNKVWLVIKNNQITEVLLQTSHNGVYVFDNVSLNIYDENGNMIGTITNGKYFVYEVIIDSDGNITWIRISKDGEPVYWINIYFQETNWGNFLTFEKEIERENGVLKLLKRNKGSLVGFLGILFVSLGAIMYAKKSKKSKSVDNGTFAVYEVNKDENGYVDEVRVSPDNYDEEYWIKF